ncbi:MAG TPA: class I SAM-dependent methyltransferase, partial [Casimicrobiaceae bacterium]|nr:class I SAM-dependent methyltransferase [Casimicrobiaceae bacterium]
MTNPAAMPRMQLVHPDITRACAESEIYETLLALDGATILELGCGKADHTRRIAAAHPTATLIATEVDRIQHAINLAADVPSNMRFTDFGAEAIALPDASVDVVMMFKSLHHVPVARLDDALNEIARVLRPGGVAYISEPLFAGPLNEVIRIFNDEQAVREAAFDALCRAVACGKFELETEFFFLLPVKYGDFADFAKRHFEVTHSERHVTEAQRVATE